MGVTLTANNSEYSFDMGYGGFFNLRRNIALALDSEFGDNYAQIIKCFSEEAQKLNDIQAEEIINRKGLDKDFADVLDFLYGSDCSGETGHRTCKKILDLIKDMEFTDKGFRYGAYRHNDWEEFKAFLQECYTKRRKMRWY